MNTHYVVHLEDNVDILPWLIVALLGLFIFHSKAPFRRNDGSRNGKKPYMDDRINHSADQLKFVMSASFAKKKLMNSGEYRVFKLIESELRSRRNGMRVFAQTSLGEILSSADQKAFDSINSKRVDILVIDGYGNPVLAVEHQGEGHYQGDAAARDAIKREALRRAGVALIETQNSDVDDEVMRKILPALG